MHNCRKHKNYIPLHGHSAYSLGDGVTKIEDIIKRTKEIGADAVALTEHGNMSSFLKFYKQARSENIKPILGCELYLNDAFFELDKEEFLKQRKKNKEDDTEEEDKENSEGDYDTKNSHLLVYGKNYEGVKNLLYLSNEATQNFYYKPLVSSEMVYTKLDKNNIVTTGCLNSEFNKMILKGQEDSIDKILKKYKDKFEDNFYLEIQVNGLNEQNFVNEYYKKVYKKLGIKPVFALDYHYANKDDWYLQYLLYTIKGRKTIKDYTPDDWFYGVRNLYIKEIDEIYEIAEKNNLDKDFLEESIDSTFEIRDKINIEIPLYLDNYPKFTSTKIESENIFDKILNERWHEKIKLGLIPNDKIEIYRERLDFELKIMKEKNILDYFLILDDLIQYVYSIGGATGAGRGSAAGSLVLFVFGITKVDPIKWDLFFERFINPERIDPPDVDCDISSDAQKKVEGYLKEKYGEDTVCHISNFIKFKPKSIIKDLCRVYELDFMLSNKLTGMFNEYGDLTIEQELLNSRKLAVDFKDNNLINFIDNNSKLFLEKGQPMVNIVRQLGKHASGILISNKKLIDSELPIVKSKGEIVTGVQEGSDEREITELGYLKLDILGLITAQINNDALKLIEKNHNKTNLENELLISNFDDKLVYEEFQKGNCKDIFQFGSLNMINLIKSVSPNNILELCAINAIYRPAIIMVGGVDEYIKNKQNITHIEKKLKLIDNDLWDILKETFGVIAYQEQVMQILKKIGGFTLAEADKSRKILKLLHKGNQEKNKDFVEMLKKFRSGALQKGLSEENSEWLLNILAKYSEYSFNKSHSFGYSVNAYISMWLKVYYPFEYFTSLLNNSNEEDRSDFIKEAKSRGIKFYDLKYNKSDTYFSIDYTEKIIRMSLSMVKGVQSKDVTKIINNKEIKNLNDLIEFTKNEKFGKRAIERFTRLGFFTEIFENRKGLENILLETRGLTQKKLDLIPEIIEKSKAMPDYIESELLNFEREYLNFYISEHPFITKINILKNRNGFTDVFNSILLPIDLDKIEAGRYYTCGIINSIEIKKTKTSKREYCVISIEDVAKKINIKIWEIQAMNDLKVGDFIFISVEKNNFGFTKNKNDKIIKL